MSSRAKRPKAKKFTGVEEPNIIGTIWLPAKAELVGGLVTVPYKGKEVSAEFHPAKMELILLLNELRMRDMESNLPRELQGWRRYDKLIPLLDNSQQLKESLIRTVCDINKAFRMAAKKVLPKEVLPPLVDTKRLFGVHLHWQFRLETTDENVFSWR